MDSLARDKDEIFVAYCTDGQTAFHLANRLRKRGYAVIKVEPPRGEFDWEIYYRAPRILGRVKRSNTL